MNEQPPEFDYDVLDVHLKRLFEHALAARDAFIMRDFERGFEELIGAQVAMSAAKAQIHPEAVRRLLNPSC